MDRKLLKLLNQRLEIVSRIGLEKARHGQEVFDPVREAELIGRMRRANRGPLSDSGLITILRAMLAVTRGAQKEYRIACVGRAGSEAHAVAWEFFGMGAKYRLCGTAASARRLLRRGECHFWVARGAPGRGFECAAEIESSLTPGRPYKLIRVARLDGREGG